MSGWCNTSDLPPWADFWDEEWIPRSSFSMPGLELERDLQAGPGEALGCNEAGGGRATDPCIGADVSAGTGYWLTSSSSPSLSQDVKAAVEEIDSIVNELWRTALPHNTSFLSDNIRLSEAEVPNACLKDSQITEWQNASQTLSALAVNQNPKGVERRVAIVGVVDSIQNSNETEANNSNPKHKCDKCDKCYIWLNDLVKHKKVHSGKHHKCPQCNKSYALKSDLYKHQKVHSFENKIICKHCGKSFVSTGDMHKHIRIHTGERPYFCKLCDKSFSASDNFKKHLRIHSGDKPLVCSDCGQRFLKKSNLQQHRRIHLGEKPFQCETCGMNFTQKTHLKTHISTHSGLKPYFCLSCNQCFTRNADLKRHVNRVHSDEAGNRGL